MALSTRPPAMRASFSSERDNRACFLTQLPIDIGELRPQFLDAGMAIEQRRGLLGKLRAQRHPLFRTAGGPVRN
jgi:hypothetical protein